MRISRVLPDNIPGAAGRSIQELNDYLQRRSNQFDSTIPDFHRLVLLSDKADGDSIPKIGFLGKDSQLNQIMEGRFGTDYADAVRNQDPAFDKAVAGGYAAAASGYSICELVEMEVTPPGAVTPLFVSYYRLISPLILGPGKTALVSLTAPSAASPSQVHLFLPDRGYQRAN